MKLELKHLAGYLPYQLEAEMLDYKRDYVGKQYDRIVGFHQWDSRCLYWSVLTAGGSKPALNSIKPILSPMSNLSSFHISVLRSIRFPNAEQWTKQHYKFIKEVQSFPMLQILPIVEKLHEWHFDIHNLIENDLAIDINTIKQITKSQS